MLHSNTFKLSWSGSDTGSGIRDYALYVSENSGPATIFLSNTSTITTTFTGTPGKNYAFYSVAQDQTGNVENIPDEPDTRTLIGILGDVNGDGLVNCNDLKIVKLSFGKKTGQAGFDPRADVNNDGVVDVKDLATVSRQLPIGTVCK